MELHHHPINEPMPPHPVTSDPALDDAELVRRTARNDEAAFEIIMRRHNGRLFRVARAILKNDAEAEDALQEAYIDAYRNIGKFRGDANLSTWLTRIVINQALGRLRRRKRDGVVVPFAMPQGSEQEHEEGAVADTRTDSPETAAMRADIRRLLEQKLDELPVAFRTVFIMREVEEMTVEETAACLSIPSATVRTRLFRARALLRESLARDVDMASAEVFAFAGERCDRIVARALERFRALAAAAAGGTPPTPNDRLQR
jgi:RNA polymerase sigma-70 factor, ECF subfamily